MNSEGLVGKMIADRYIILGSLGAGAMGTVYKARHKHLNREVALKVLKRDACTDDLSRKRFENEAKAASKLNHQNLIAVTDFGFASGLGMDAAPSIDSPFLVMDYVEGIGLDKLLKQQKTLPDEQLLNIMVQICAGLAHAHEKGLVHRDLKPSNILITQSEDGHELVKVVDFGLAKAINAEQDLTTTGQIFGTPLYMSPEQCQGRKLDERSDVYSLGCLMYRMLAGKLPFSGDTPVTTIIMHVREAPPAIPADRLDSDFKRALVPIIFKALQKDPPQRHQSVNELRIELISAMEGVSKVEESETSQPATVQIPAPPVSKKRIAAVLAICTMLPLVLIVGGVLATTMHNKAVRAQEARAQAQVIRPDVLVSVTPIAPMPIAPAVVPPKPQQPTKRPVTQVRKTATHVSHRAPKKKSFWKKLINTLLD